MNQTGTANVWAGISVDPETGLVFLPVSSPSPNYYGGDRLKEMPLRHCDRRGECRDRRSGVEPPACPSRHLGRGHQLRAHPGGHQEGRPDHSRPDPGDQDGLPVRAQPQHRRAGLSDRGAALSGLRRAGRSRGQDPALCAAAGTDRSPDNTPPVSTLADIAQLRANAAAGRRASATKAATRRRRIRGSISWPATVGGVEWGGGALDPTTNTYVVNSDSVLQVYTLVPRAEADKNMTATRCATGRLLPRSRVRPTASGCRTSSTCGACPAGRRLTAPCPPMT